MTNVPPNDDWPNQVPPAPTPAAPTAAAPTAAGPVAGWYPDGSGATRWWDGTQWGQIAPAAAPAPPCTPCADSAHGSCSRRIAVSGFSRSTLSWASAATLGNLVLGKWGAD